MAKIPRLGLGWERDDLSNTSPAPQSPTNLPSCQAKAPQIVQARRSFYCLIYRLNGLATTVTTIITIKQT